MADAIVVLNRREQEYYDKYAENVVLVPNPVIVSPHLFPKKQKIVLCVGHLSKLKNFQDAITAFHEADLEKHGWSLVIIGEGEQEDNLRNLVTSFGLQRVEFYSETSQINEWYAKSSILLCTSLVEVFSLAVAEATAFGVVPLSYDLDGPAYILEEFPDLLVETGSVSALAERLRSLGHDGSLADYAKRVRSVCDRFSRKVVADAWSWLLKGG
jgi:glycosyltransferase involved in cell wall biosynthesis